MTESGISIKGNTSEIHSESVGSIPTFRTFDNLSVKLISCKDGKKYIIEHHYSHGCHNAPSPIYGLFQFDDLIGVLAFATPCSENVRASIFGKEYVNNVIELHRLHILDGTPKNIESWFISRCLKMIQCDKPRIKAVVSFADSTVGHKGIIYQATNAYFYGMSPKSTFYIDTENRLHHPRQCGKNISVQMALDMGWKPVKRNSKYRYFWLIGNKNEKRKYFNLIKVAILPYPKVI